MRTDPGGRAMFDMDLGAHRDLVALAIGLERLKRRRLHEPDHVRRRVNRRQFGMMRGQRVLVWIGRASIPSRFVPAVLARSIGDELMQLPLTLFLSGVIEDFGRRLGSFSRRAP